MFCKVSLFLFALLLLPPVTAGQTSKFEMVKVADGVYAAIQPEDYNKPSNSNSIIIINDDDVIVVDTNLTPSSAKEVLAEIRKLTNKPVRYVVNTHNHSDHVQGNQVYQDAFPQVEFIAHKNMREIYLKYLPTYKDSIEAYRKIVAESPERLRTGKKENGEAMTEQEKSSLARQYSIARDYLPEVERLRPTGPTITIENELTLYRGKRQIKLLYLGRGNTAGDLIVYLPQEKILVTGDLVVSPVPFAFDSYIGEWIETLKKLRALDAEIIIPGHGAVQRNKEYLELETSLLQTTLKQVRDAAGRGLSLEETRKVIDLESFRLRLAGDDAGRSRAFRGFFVAPAVEQAYKEVKGLLP
jgi:glyoxylase-like metal-dependent hydrolase (beta-lactamase superfamily II)